jgi:ABC-type lipoprotein release transport system permease subunit
VAGPERLGGFSLRGNHVSPPAAFVDRRRLAAAVGRPRRANLLLHFGDTGGAAPPTQYLWTVRNALRLGIEPADLGLAVRPTAQPGIVQVEGEGFYLDPGVFTNVAWKELPRRAAVLSYVVNNLEAHGRSTPYSIVAGTSGPPVPPALADDEILVNEWLAEDLGLAPGDRLRLVYSVLGPRRQLTEVDAAFTVRGVLPLAGAAADPSFLPTLPGFTGKEDCADWDPGLPIDLERIRPKDEAYWDRHGGTPKAFITHARAQRIWRNPADPYGRISLTAVRFAPAGPPPPAGEAAAAPAGKVSRAELLARGRATFRAALGTPVPETLGLETRPVRAEALAAARQGVDFGQLFLGLSFFLLLAALLLTGLLFVLQQERRAAEAGLLRALGYSRSDLLRSLLREGAGLALAGALLGLLGGVLYNRLIVAGLAGLWRGAVGTEALITATPLATLLLGGAAGWLSAVAALALACRRLRRLPPAALLARAPQPRGRGRRHSLLLAVAGLGCLLGSGAVAGRAGDGGGGEAALFFAAGALLLLAFLLLAAALLHALAGWPGMTRHLPLRPYGLILRGLARRPGRALATTGALACGVFLVVTVSSHEINPYAAADRRTAGTGGYDYWGEFSVPLPYDLASPEGRRELRLDEDLLRGVTFLQARRREGQEASCLNLNRVRRPSLLGVDSEALAARGAFSFAAPARPAAEVWPRLQAEPDAPPAAAADADVIRWSLGKSVGDRLRLPPDALGRVEPVVGLTLALETSVFQGYVLLDDEVFRRLYGDAGGTGVILVDAPPERAHAVRRHLERRLRDYGLALTPTAQRLAAFARVQNVYLGIFHLLGRLGLLLGSAGVGVLMLRSVLEREGELALLRAVGWQPAELRGLLLQEHALLVLAGVAAGAAAAVLAARPALAGASADGALVDGMGLTIGVLALGGLAWVTLAARLALRRNLLPALRDE